MENQLTLFDSHRQTDLRSKRHAEGLWEYVNKTTREGFDYLRDMLEAWFSSFEVSVEIRRKFRVRFRSRDNVEHLGAFFELYLYTVLKGSGFDVTVEPDNYVGRPDFLVRGDTGHSLVVEATSVLPKDQFGGQTNPSSTLVDFLNDHLKSPDFWITLAIERLGQRTPPLTSIRSDIERWLSGLSYDTELTRSLSRQGVNRNHAQFGGVQSIWTCRRGDWKFHLSASPKLGRRSENSEFISAINYGVRTVRHAANMASAIGRKASKYKNLGIPFIIAINCAEPGMDEEDVIDALFGDVAIRVNPSGRNESIRRANGAWLGPRGFQKRSVSGAWIFNRVSPVNLLNRDSTLWHHPAARYPIAPEAFVFDQKLYDASTDSFIHHSGVQPSDCLGIDQRKVPW